MSIQVFCPQCGSAFQVPSWTTDQQSKCPHCGQTVQPSVGPLPGDSSHAGASPQHAPAPADPAAPGDGAPGQGGGPHSGFVPEAVPSVPFPPSEAGLQPDSPKKRLLFWIGIGTGLAVLVLVGFVAMVVFLASSRSRPQRPLAGNFRGAPLPGSGGPGSPVSPSSLAAVNKDVSREEALQFAEQLSQAFAERDVAAVNRLIHWDLLLARSFRDLDLPPAFLQGAEQGIRRKGILDVVQSLGNTGKVSFLQVKQRDGFTSVLFRVVDQSQSLNYHEYLLVRHQGRIVAADIHVLALGSTMSQLIRRNLVAVGQHLPKGVLGKLFGASRTVLAKHERDLLAISQAMRTRDFDSFLAAYRRLPEELRRIYMVQLVRLQLAAASPDEKHYLEAYRDFVRYFPDDPALNFMSIDFYVARKQFDKARKQLKTIRKLVGDDPYLDFLEGVFFSAAQQPDMALQKYRSAIAKKLDLPLAHWEAAALLLEQGRMAELVEILQGLEQHGVPRDEIEETLREFSPDHYRKFRQSAEYRRWSPGASSPPQSEREPPQAP